MFTGIIEEKALVKSLEEKPDSGRLTIVSKLDHSKAKLGNSICINGVCLTLVGQSAQELVFELASETLRCTNLGQLRPESPVNLERSLKIGDSVDGHFVFGHVDCLTQLISRSKEGDTWRLELSLSPEMQKYFAPKGSVSLNGVSLTVGEVSPKSFSVYIIPHTFEHTNLGQIEIRAQVNLEIDMLSRYVARNIEMHR